MRTITARHISTAICLFVLQALSLHTSQLFASEWVNAIGGKWQVTEVHINTEASATTGYSWNDPRLVGRLFNFEPGALWNDTPESGECIAPSARSVHIEPSRAIASSMGEYGYPPKRASDAAYKVDLKDSDNTSIVQIYCEGKLWHDGLGADGGILGAWIVPVGPDRMLLRWFNETLLILNRVPNDAQPNPSFSCSKSGSETEQTICRSYELAAFDRSISTAYQQLLTQAKESGGEGATVIENQRLWIKMRNACKTDKKCLVDTMKKHLERLASQNRM